MLKEKTAGALAFEGGRGVTHTGDLTAGRFLIGNGVSDIKISGVAYETSGNVGLGTITPQQRLDIQSGALRFTTLAAPGASVAALAGSGAGNVTNGAHIYKITFVNPVGETELGTASNTITVVDSTTNGQISITGIPVSTDATVTARRIYRTKAGGSTYFFIATLSDNTTTIYTDNTADASLPATAGQYASNNSTSGWIFLNNAPVFSLYGAFNTFVGLNVGNTTLTGSGFNQGFGYNNLAALTTGVSNCAFGSFTLSGVTTGSSNCGFGVSCLTALTTGSGNTGYGANALRLETGSLNGARSSAFGNGALQNQNGADGNTAFGRLAGNSTTTGGAGIYIGDQAGTANGGTNITTQSGVVIIGYRPYAVAVSNFLNISNSLYGYGLNSTGGILGTARVGVNIFKKLSAFSVGAPADIVGNGTTTANASTTITGSSTLFLSDVGIGDRISLSSSAGTYAIVTAIASDTSLTVSAALGNGTSQTINIKRSIFRLDDSSSVMKFLVDDRGYIFASPPVGNTGLSTGYFYQDTAANVLINGDNVVAIKFTAP